MFELLLPARGEDGTPSAACCLSIETPPHAWRRYFTSQLLYITLGNISTCVEKITKGRQSPRESQKHCHGEF